MLVLLELLRSFVELHLVSDQLIIPLVCNGVETLLSKLIKIDNLDTILLLSLGRLEALSSWLLILLKIVSQWGGSCWAILGRFFFLLASKYPSSSRRLRGVCRLLSTEEASSCWLRGISGLLTSKQSACSWLGCICRLLSSE